MDLESFLITLYVLVTTDGNSATHGPHTATRSPSRTLRYRGLNTPHSLIVIALPKRDFWRFADVHLRRYFPKLLSQDQLNRRIRALEPQLKALQRDLAETLLDNTCAIYHVLDTTLIPAMVRVWACRKRVFAGLAAFGRCASTKEWFYSFKVALSVTPEDVITAFVLAPANWDDRPIGEFLVACDGHGSYLADKGFSSIEWERYWLEHYGELVAATPQESARRA